MHKIKQEGADNDNTNWNWVIVLTEYATTTNVPKVCRIHFIQQHYIDVSHSTIAAYVATRTTSLTPASGVRVSEKFDAKKTSVVGAGEKRGHHDEDAATGSE